MDYFYKTEKSFYVEPTSRCNYNCRMCFEKPEACDITFEKFKIIVKKTDLDFVKLWGRGEPFLNKEIYLILEYCYKKKIKIFITSNFSLVDFKQKALNYIDVICVSLHASNSEIYKRVTGSERFDEVVENIKRFKVICSNIYCKSVITSLNETDVESFKLLCKTLDVKCIVTGFDLPDNYRIQDLVELYPVTEEANRKFNRYLPYSLISRNKFKKCSQPAWPMILADGSVYTCCKRPSSGFIGNIFEDNFRIDNSVIEVAKSRGLVECQNCTIQ